MAGENKMGYQGRLFYGVAGAEGTTQVTNCVDLDYDQQPERGNTTVRGAGTSPPVKTSKVTAIGATITWKMRNKSNDTTLTALRAAAATGAAVALRTKDNATGTGFDGDCTISCKNSMPLEGEQAFEFSAEPTNDAGREPLLNA